MSPDAATVLELDCVGRSFGAVDVLTAATLRARAGEITAILGRNGSGKTTLLRVATGRLRAGHGAISMDGHRVDRPSLHRLARLGLAYVPQTGLLPRGRTVGDVARAVVRAWRRRNDPPVDAVIAAWAEAWDLSHLLDSLREELSTGERNRASMGAVALRAPRCLLADEPLTGSAPLDRERLGRALRGLADDGCAVVVTGHEATDLMELADRIVWLTAGTTHDLGTPGQARGSDAFRREYLGDEARPLTAPPAAPLATDGR